MTSPDTMTKIPLVSLLCDRRLWLGTFGGVCLLLLLINFKVTQLREQFAEAQRENLLQHAPQLSDASKGLEGVQYDLSTGIDLVRYWPAIPDATRQPLAIVCGMSQINTINEYQPGDKIIPELMDDELAPQGARVFGLNSGNLSNEEALFLLQAAVSNPRTTPKAFIYGVCFDKFRNIDLRRGYRTFLSQHPEVASAWEKTAASALETHPLAGEKMQRTLADVRAEADKGAEETFEGRLRLAIATGVPLVEQRQALNSMVRMQLYVFRNWLFGIKPSTKRAIIEGRYRLNQEFFHEMIRLSRQHGVTLCAYVVPLNPLAENPYVPEQYAEFKAWLEQTCREGGVPFANFEDIVPTEHWGTFMGGPDFKHFKAMGHKLSARALIDRFAPEIFDTPAAGAPTR